MNGKEMEAVAAVAEPPLADWDIVHLPEGVEFKSSDEYDGPKPSVCVRRTAPAEAGPLIAFRSTPFIDYETGQNVVRVVYDPSTSAPVHAEADESALLAARVYCDRHVLKGSTREVYDQVVRLHREDRASVTTSDLKLLVALLETESVVGKENYLLCLPLGWNEAEAKAEAEAEAEAGVELEPDSEPDQQDEEADADVPVVVNEEGEEVEVEAPVAMEAEVEVEAEAEPEPEPEPDVKLAEGTVHLRILFEYEVEVVDNYESPQMPLEDVINYPVIVTPWVDPTTGEIQANIHGGDHAPSSQAPKRRRRRQRKQRKTDRTDEDGSDADYKEGEEENEEKPQAPHRIFTRSQARK
jgi:hypothetical protein